MEGKDFDEEELDAALAPIAERALQQITDEAVAFTELIRCYMTGQQVVLKTAVPAEKNFETRVEIPADNYLISHINFSSTSPRKNMYVFLARGTQTVSGMRPSQVYVRAGVLHVQSIEEFVQLFGIFERQERLGRREGKPSWDGCMASAQ